MSDNKENTKTEKSNKDTKKSEVEPVKDTLNTEVEEKKVEETNTKAIKEDIKSKAETKNTVKEAKTQYSFSIGDTVKVFYKIVEGNKVRVQPYEGIVIAIKGKGDSKTFTVRRIGVGQVGIERIFPIKSPNIERITITKYGKVRKAKLYYLREKIGKAATKIKERKVLVK